MANLQCTQQLDDGTQCGAIAIDGSQFCFSHDPESREEKREACRKGGYYKGKAGKIQEPLPDIPISTVHDIHPAIETVMTLMTQRRVSPSEARELVKVIRLKAKLLGWSGI